MAKAKIRAISGTPEPSEGHSNDRHCGVPVKAGAAGSGKDLKVMALDRPFTGMSQVNGEGLEEVRRGSYEQAVASMLPGAHDGGRDWGSLCGSSNKARRMGNYRQELSRKVSILRLKRARWAQPPSSA